MRRVQRAAVFGLLAGLATAAVAEAVRPRGGTSVLVDWDEVRSAAHSRLERSEISTASLAAAQKGYRAMASKLEEPLLEFVGGLPTGVDLPRFEAVDREGWLDLNLNILGMLLHVVANAFDNADGQLARLTNRQSRMGRVIDSLADHLIWLSIYFNLALRYVVAGSSITVGLLALAAGLSHACQGAAADYYRNGYLYFVRGRSRADLDSSLDLRMEFRDLRWRDQSWHKFLLALYLNFTSQQELLAPGLQRLHKAIERAFPEEIPLWLQKRYRDIAQPMLRWWRLLMTNTRMLFLFLLLFIGQPIWYFWLELTLFNFLLVYLLLYQERASQSLLQLVNTHREAA